MNLIICCGLFAVDSLNLVPSDMQNDGSFVSSKGKEPSVSTKVGNCFASSLKSAFEGRHKAVELILGKSENIVAFV